MTEKHLIPFKIIDKHYFLQIHMEINDIDRYCLKNITSDNEGAGSTKVECSLLSVAHEQRGILEANK